MKIITILALCLAMTGCTYTITMVHTEGEASDVVDETSTATPSTDVSVPVSLTPNML